MKCFETKQPHNYPSTVLLQSSSLLEYSQKGSSVNQSNVDHLVQILLIGDTGVGKSSLIARYADGEFIQGLIGTAGVDHKEKNIEHLSRGIKMRIWDSAG